MEIQKRIEIEKNITAKVVDCILAHPDLYISVSDGECCVVKRSQNKAEIIEALYSTDEDILMVRKNEGEESVYIGNVHLVYGNDGFDVISNYSTRLESIIKEALDYSDEIADQN